VQRTYPCPSASITPSGNIAQSSATSAAGWRRMACTPIQTVMRSWQALRTQPLEATTVAACARRTSKIVASPTSHKPNARSVAVVLRSAASMEHLGVSRRPRSNSPPKKNASQLTSRKPSAVTQASRGSSAERRAAAGKRPSLIARPSAFTRCRKSSRIFLPQLLSQPPPAPAASTAAKPAEDGVFLPASPVRVRDCKHEQDKR